MYIKKSAVVEAYQWNGGDLKTDPNVPLWLQEMLHNKPYEGNSIFAGMALESTPDKKLKYVGSMVVISKVALSTIVKGGWIVKDSMGLVHGYSDKQFQAAFVPFNCSLALASHIIKS